MCYVTVKLINVNAIGYCASYKKEYILHMLQLILLWQSCFFFQFQRLGVSSALLALHFSLSLSLSQSHSWSVYLSVSLSAWTYVTYVKRLPSEIHIHRGRLLTCYWIYHYRYNALVHRPSSVNACRCYVGVNRWALPKFLGDNIDKRLLLHKLSTTLKQNFLQVWLSGGGGGVKYLFGAN